MKQYIQLVAMGLWLFFVGCVLHGLYNSQLPKSTEDYFTYTVIDLQGDTITRGSWVADDTRELQIKNIGTTDSPCLVAIRNGNRQDVLLCEVKKILRFTRFADLNLVQ